MTLEELKQKATASELTLIEAVEKTQEENIQVKVRQRNDELARQLSECFRRNTSDIRHNAFFMDEIKRILYPESK